MNIRAIVLRQRGLLALATVLGLAGAAATLTQPLLISELIRAVAAGESIFWPIVWICALFAADAVLVTTHLYLVGRVGENIVLDMRTTLVGRLLGSKIQEFDRLERGDVFTRTVSDTSLARVALSSSLAQLITSGFMVVGCVVAMLLIDWLLLLVAGACLGVASIAALVLARAVRRAAVTNRTDTSRFGSALARALGSLTTVKASRAEAREAERVGAVAQDARTSGLRVIKLSALFMPSMNVGTQVSLAVVIAWGMARTATGDLPVQDLTAFIMYLFYMVSPLVMLFMALGELQQGRAAIDRVVDLARLAQETSPPDAATAVVIREPDRESSDGDAGAAVEFDGVSFGYSEEAVPALVGVSFSVPRVGLTAIVGPSGAGKTTLFRLIENFYVPTEGTVRVAGRSTADWSLHELRSRIGLVEQDNPLLRGTVRDNLTYARPEATEQDIVEVLGMAHLAEVVDNLPRGLDTELGEGGAGLSGGQRQRLAIARAMLADPDVLLLDEATAHLDSDSEAALREAITMIGRRCQVLTIAHRISTVTGADQILVMEDGGIRARGTHDYLIESDETYHRLATHQLSPAVGGAAR